MPSTPCPFSVEVAGTIEMGFETRASLSTLGCAAGALGAIVGAVSSAKPGAASKSPTNVSALAGLVGSVRARLAER